MAYPVAILLAHRLKRRLAAVEERLRKKSFRWWPAHLHVSRTGSGGFKLGGGLTAQPVIHLNRTGTGGFLVGGASAPKIALHLSGSGGFKIGGTATGSATALTDLLVYPEVEALVPSINPDDVEVELPQEYE